MALSGMTASEAVTANAEPQIVGELRSLNNARSRIASVRQRISALRARVCGPTPEGLNADKKVTGGGGYLNGLIMETSEIEELATAIWMDLDAIERVL